MLIVDCFKKSEKSSVPNRDFHSATYLQILDNAKQIKLLIKTSKVMVVKNTRQVLLHTDLYFGFQTKLLNI